MARQRGGHAAGKALDSSELVFTDTSRDGRNQRRRLPPGVGLALALAERQTPDVPAPVRLSRQDFDAFVSDLDGVITDTASLHARAWTSLFDEFLAVRSPRPREDCRPFGDDDYRRFVDGRARADGVAGFLSSRGIVVPEHVARSLAERKDSLFLDLLHAEGTVALPGVVLLLTALRDEGFGTAVVSASRNCETVLSVVGLGHLFDERVDGVVASTLGLAGKPDPALYQEAARRLGVSAARAVVVEDALPGVRAGRRGGFGLVVGVDRARDGAELIASGADVVVRDLTGIAVVRGRRPGGSR